MPWPLLIIGGAFMVKQKLEPGHDPEKWLPVFRKDHARSKDVACLMSMRVIGLAGWSGSGKTTLISKVIPVLVGRGLRVSTVKHAHHAFDIDRPGKDSWLHREAGASRSRGRLEPPLGAGA